MPSLLTPRRIPGPGQARDPLRGAARLLRVGVSGVVNVHARLREPTTLATPKGPMEVVEVSFFADEPRSVVERARAYVAAG